MRIFTAFFFSRLICRIREWKERPKNERARERAVFGTLYAGHFAPSIRGSSGTTPIEMIDIYSYPKSILRLVFSPLFFFPFLLRAHSRRVLVFHYAFFLLYMVRGFSFRPTAQIDLRLVFNSCRTRVVPRRNEK